MFVLVMNNDYVLLTVPMALVTEHPIASAGVSGCVCVAGGMGCYSTKSMTLDQSGCHVRRVLFSLHVKDILCRFLKITGTL